MVHELIGSFSSGIITQASILGIVSSKPSLGDISHLRDFSSNGMSSFVRCHAVPESGFGWYSTMLLWFTTTQAADVDQSLGTARVKVVYVEVLM